MEEIGLEQGLRKLRVWTRFMHNFNNKSISHLSVFTEDVYLSGVFSWSETKEGHSFWRGISGELYDLGCAQH